MDPDGFALDFHLQERGHDWPALALCAEDRTGRSLMLGLPIFMLGRGEVLLEVGRN